MQHVFILAELSAHSLITKFVSSKNKIKERNMDTRKWICERTNIELTSSYFLKIMMIFLTILSSDF